VNGEPSKLLAPDRYGERAQVCLESGTAGWIQRSVRQICEIGNLQVTNNAAPCARLIAELAHEIARGVEKVHVNEAKEPPRKGELALDPIAA